MIRSNPLDFVLRAKDHGDALVQALGLDVENGLVPVGCGAAGLEALAA